MVYFYKETQSLIDSCFLLVASQDFTHSSLTLGYEGGSKILFVLNFDIILDLNIGGSSNVSMALIDFLH